MDGLTEDTNTCMQCLSYTSWKITGTKYTDLCKHSKMDAGAMTPF